MHILNPESSFMQTIFYIGDLLMLNICFMICCIPIVTIGASVTALYAVTLNKLDESSVLTRFFSAFVRNFKQSTLAWLGILAVLVFIAADFYLLTVVNIPGGMFMLVLLGIATFLTLGTSSYLFPLIGHFTNSLRKTFKNAFVLSISMLPKTILMLVIAWFPLVMYFFDVELFLRCMLPWMLVGFSVTARLNSNILRRIFLKIAPQEEGKNTSQID